MRAHAPESVIHSSPTAVKYSAASAAVLLPIPLARKSKFVYEDVINSRHAGISRNNLPAVILRGTKIMLKASTAPVLGVPVDWFFFPSCFHSVNKQPHQFFSALFTFCLEPFSWGNSSEIGNFESSRIFSGLRPR